MKKSTFILSLFMTTVSLVNTGAQTNHQKTKSNPYTSMEQLKSNLMENQAKEVVQAFLSAVQQGKHETLGALLHSSVEWSQPGNNRVSGMKRSSAEVFEMVGNMFEISANTLVLTDVKVLAVNGNSVACLLHWKAAQPVGLVLDVDNIDVYTVENGKITKATVYSADLVQEDTFWGR